MALFNAIRPAAGREARALSFITPPIGPRIEAMQKGFGGDTETSLRIGAVWKCTRLVAEVMSYMKPIVYRGPGQGFGAAVRQPTPPNLAQPSANANTFDFTYMAMVSLLLRGNVFGRILGVDGQGRPTQIELQHPDQVRVRENADGTITYKFGAQTVPNDQVWHKMAYRMAGLPIGLSPIKYAQDMISQSHNATLFGNRFFEDGGHPSGILTNDTAKFVNQDEADTVKKRFLQATRGGREPVAMGGGWKYQAIQIAPEESQFLETQKFTGSQICGFFGVPPEIVAEASEGSAITYANIDSRAIDFLKFGIQGWVERLEDWYTELVPRGQYVKLDESKLLRTDALTRWQIHHMQVGGRILAGSEIRTMEDIPPATPEQQAEIDALITPLAPPIGSPKAGS